MIGASSAMAMTARLVPEEHVDLRNAMRREGRVATWRVELLERYMGVSEAGGGKGGARRTWAPRTTLRKGRMLAGRARNSDARKENVIHNAVTDSEASR